MPDNLRRGPMISAGVLLSEYSPNKLPWDLGFLIFGVLLIGAGALSSAFWPPP